MLAGTAGAGVLAGRLGDDDSAPEPTFEARLDDSGPDIELTHDGGDAVTAGALGV